MNKEYLISMMKNCKQFENQSVYDHCVSVQDIFKKYGTRQPNILFQNGL